MSPRVGIILLDITNLILRVFDKRASGLFLVYSQDKRLEGFDKKELLRSAEVIDLINNFFILGESLKVDKFQICSRDIPEELIKKVSLSLKFPIKELGFTEEQDLITRGLASKSFQVINYNF